MLYILIYTIIYTNNSISKEKICQYRKYINERSQADD